MTEAEADAGAGITPGRIAAAVAGIVALLIMGVGLGLWMTGDDPEEVAQEDEAAADSPFPAESEVFGGQQGLPPSQDFGQGELEPVPTRPEQNGGTGQPTPEAVPPSGGQGGGGNEDLQPGAGGSEAPGTDGGGEAPGTDGGGEAPGTDGGEAPGTDGGSGPGADGGDADGGADPDDPSGELGEPLPQDGGTLPQDGGTLPQDGGAQGPFPDQPPPDDDGALDLPRLFDIPEPPPGTNETSTRVSRTDDGTQTRSEQVTALDTDLGEVAVSAERNDDAAAQAERAAQDAVGEIRLDSGATAYLLPGGRLVWLEPAAQQAAQDTLLEVDGPTAIDTDDLIDIANAVEVRG